MQCNGAVTAGIIGGTEFHFTIVNNNVIVDNLPANTKVKRDIPVPPGFFVLPSPPPPTTPTGVRCPNPGQVAVLKSPPVPPTANGCGTDTGIGSFVPELDFHTCCDGHDFCYGTASIPLSAHDITSRPRN